jgi:hypothetical protein
LKGDLKNLSPFLDDKGLMRVGGRIHNDLVPYNAAHPIILPKLNIPEDRDLENVDTCQLTKKIVAWAHKATFHGGAAKTESLLSTRFYIHKSIT